MIKTAIVYDRWLQTLGGGEVVACNIAKILKNSGYEVTLVSGKKVSQEIIYEKLHIDLSGIKFVVLWNDEFALKKLSEDKDLFINISFMDYSRGYAKKNLYYVNFPTKPFITFKGLVFSLLAPFVTRFVKPIESMSTTDSPRIIRGRPAYLLERNNRYAIYNLHVGNVQTIEFSLLIENFSKTQLKKISLSLDNADLLNTWTAIFHESNILVYILKFKPKSNTVYLNIQIKDFGKQSLELEQGNIYLLYPKIELKKLSNFLFSDFLNKFQVRMRAGIFVNILGRLRSYQHILTYSVFAQKWIKKYWKRNPLIIAPPVSFIFNDYNLAKYKKKNWICSVGRFFTLGHGKKQEVMIEAFKKIYDQGCKDWELHLGGGLGNEPSSIEFFQYLKDQSEGYPVYFHINVSRKEIEEIYLNSRIYWHATGFDENESYQPVRFEHFGISPIEAVSAGCIPVLYKGGGLPEIITQLGLDPEKYLFNSIKTLVALTINQIKNPDQINWKEMRSILEKKYSYQTFKKKFLEAVNY
jgi:glycosyltransferase involved in cell wall biosynthesis